MAMLSSATWIKVVWKGDEFVAIAADTTKTAKSTDGVTWTEYNGLPGAYSWSSMAWNGAVLCALRGSTGRTVAISSDGITWTEYATALPANGNWVDIAWNGTLFVAIALSGSGGSYIASSPDGITWTTRSTTSRNHKRIAWNGNRFATHTSGTPGYWFSNTDGTSTWTAYQILGTTWAANAMAAAPAGGIFVSIAYGGDAVRIFNDSLTHADSIMPSAQNWYDVAFGASQFAAIAFGTTVAATISSSGITNATSMPVSANWISIAYGGGRFVATSVGTETAISLDDGNTWSLDVPSSAVVVGYTELTVQAPNVVTGYTALTTENPSGTVTAYTSLDMSGTGTVTAHTALAVLSLSGGLIGAPMWTARCLIDGADVSAQLTTVASVTAAEGGARLAELTIEPPDGLIAPLDYVGKDITLDYVPILGGVPVPLRLFTGRIDTPSYDFDARLIHLRCVDDLQNRVAALDRGDIDALIGGRYTEAVQGEILDNWDYAQARLTTVAASLDAGPHGGMRVTPWVSGDVWATFDAGQLLYQRTQPSYPQRSTLINQVTVSFEYRYPRLRQRYTTLGWSGTNIDMSPNGYQYPTQQEILGAAGGSGWTVTNATFYPAPASIPHSSGGFIYPPDGSIDMAILHLTQRHSQTVSEQYTITVTADESLALNGMLPYEFRGALESSFDGGAWESALDIAPFMPTGGEQDWSPDETRADADYAIQTLLDQANVKIIGSHRSAMVSNATLCNPDLDLDKRIAISMDDLTAEGKVVEVTHRLEFDNGSATTEFSIACFGAGGAGIITPDTLAPPAPPDPAVEVQDWPSSIPPLHVCTYGVTPYNDNLMGLLLNPLENIYVENIPPDSHSASFPNPSYVAGSYPAQGFRVRMPGVDDEDRNPITKTADSAYSVLVPSDPLTITKP